MIVSYGFDNLTRLKNNFVLDTKVLIAEKRVVNAHRGGTVCAGLACVLAKVCVSRACIPAKVCFAFFMTA